MLSPKREPQRRGGEPGKDPMQRCVADFVARCGRAGGATEGSILPAERLAAAVWRGALAGWGRW